MENLTKVLKDIQELITAKELLDKILHHYRIGLGFSIDNEYKYPDPEIESKLGYTKAKELVGTYKTEFEVIDNKIRNYIKYDDSE